MFGVLSYIRAVLGVLWSSLKTYFHVDTSYVRQRVKVSIFSGKSPRMIVITRRFLLPVLQVLLFPFTHVNFHRAEEMDYGAGESRPQRQGLVFAGPLKYMQARKALQFINPLWRMKMLLTFTFQ